MQQKQSIFFGTKTEMSDYFFTQWIFQTTKAWRCCFDLHSSAEWIKKEITFLNIWWKIRFPRRWSLGLG